MARIWSFAASSLTLVYAPPGSPQREGRQLNQDILVKQSEISIPQRLQSLEVIAHLKVRPLKLFQNGFRLFGGSPIVFEVQDQLLLLGDAQLAFGHEVHGPAQVVLLSIVPHGPLRLYTGCLNANCGN
jgi:hypothetical protein